jgi:hypothetical protein
MRIAGTGKNANTCGFEISITKERAIDYAALQ